MYGSNNNNNNSVPSYLPPPGFEHLGFAPHPGFPPMQAQQPTGNSNPPPPPPPVMMQPQFVQQPGNFVYGLSPAQASPAAFGFATLPMMPSPPTQPNQGTLMYGVGGQQPVS